MKSENIIVYLILVLIIGGGIFYFSEYNTKRIIKEKCNKAYNHQVKGIVDTFYYNRQGTFVVRVYDNSMRKVNKIYSTYMGVSRADRFFENGDSIYKPLNSFNYYIYKQSNHDSIVFLKNDITCDDYIDSIYDK